MSDIFGGMFDEFSVAYVEMLEAKSCLWKQTAKSWYSGDGCTQRYNEWVILSRDLREDIQADADRRGELLRDIADWYEADEADYMSASLWKRVSEELADV